MRLAAKRLIGIPAAAGAFAGLSVAIAAWVAQSPFGLAAAAIVFARVLAALIFRLDRLDWRRLVFRDAGATALACAGGSAIAGAACATLPGSWPARLLLADLALYPMLTLGVAALLRLRHERPQPARPDAERTLIWGAGWEGRVMLDRIRRSQPNVEIFGWLDDDPVLAELDCDGVPVLGPLESLPLLAELHGIRSVLVAIPRLSPERRAVAQDLARWSGVALHFTPTAVSADQGCEAESAGANAAQPTH